MLAWAIGMPVIFLGMDIAFKLAETWQSVLVIAVALLIAGLSSERSTEDSWS